jgi:hypothetical protein|tara:strand:- start:373 stop:495 length:123 start_codon:yes stop_codon:yes gene_type:complete
MIYIEVLAHHMLEIMIFSGAGYVFGSMVVETIEHYKNKKD